MQPHKHPKELITHIKAQLTAHEEPYASGAWEKFNRKKNKKPVLWLSGVAAILILGFTLIWALHQNPKKTQQHYAAIKPVEKNFIAKTNKLVQKNGSNISQQTALNVALKAQNNDLKKVKKTVNYGPKLAISNKHFTNTSIQLIAKINKQKTINLALNPQNNGLNKIKTTVSYNPGSAIVTTTLPDTLIQLITNNIIEPPSNKIADSVVTSINKAKLAKTKNLAFFDKQAKLNEAVKTNKKASKWLIGLAIAPSFGNTPKLNMGYGLNMEYAITSKISINSGVAYNQLSASKNIEGANIFPDISSIKSPSANVKNLESVNTNMSGIDIPLEIKYHISKSIYANIGVSAFAILNQQRSNNYIEEKLVTQESFTIAGEQQETNFLVYERSTQQVAENQIDNPQYLAFYNFNLGFRQKIAKKTYVAFEPFVKLPVQEITAERLRLIGTGLRLRFNF
jgi:hypothetical protein